MSMSYGRIEGLDKPVARLVQGCVELPGGPDELRRLFDAVFELGGTTFDTAHGYMGGESERRLGRWIRERGVRDRVVIITKGAHHNDDRKRVTPFDITGDLHDSLSRLGTDHVELYLLHRDDPSVEVGPIVEVLNEHRQAGLIRAFGGSNWTAARIAEANAYAAEHGLTGFAATSPNLSLAAPHEMPWPDCVSISGPDGAEQRRWYAEHRMPIIAWSALAGGFLTGRFRRDNLDRFEGYFDELVLRCYCNEANFRRLDWAKRVADDLGLTIPQVALAWLFRQELDTYAIVRSDTPEQFKANLRSLDAAALLPEDATQVGFE